MKALSHVAGATNCAVAVVHHSKKPAANDRGGPSSSDMRGASSILNASRHGRMVITMSAADADKLGGDKEERIFLLYRVRKDELLASRPQFQVVQAVERHASQRNRRRRW